MNRGKAGVAPEQVVELGGAACRRLVVGAPGLANDEDQQTDGDPRQARQHERGSPARQGP